MTRELPVLNETLCTGCGDCVPICPTDCLAMNAYLPWMPRPAACVSCTLCVLVCPAGALEMASPDEDEPEPFLSALS
ncbi:MAG TPA: 4Fe-4S dicluster domain-containing protein [Gemmataceae bacterium]|nr:4Fe-4S dicluster domain-containing protein [Gemmataceae bacterium]